MASKYSEQYSYEYVDQLVEDINVNLESDANSIDKATLQFNTFDSVRENFANTIETLQKVKEVGDTISEEDYQQLIEIFPRLAHSFIQVDENTRRLTKDLNGLSYDDIANALSSLTENQELYNNIIEETGDILDENFSEETFNEALLDEESPLHKLADQLWDGEKSVEEVVNEGGKSLELLKDKIIEIKELNHCIEKIYTKEVSYTQDDYNSEVKILKPAERQYLMSISSNDDKVLTTLKFLISLLPSYEELAFKDFKLSLTAYAANKRIKTIVNNNTSFSFSYNLKPIIPEYNKICIRIAEEISNLEKEPEVKKYKQEKELEVKKYKQEKEKYTKIIAFVPLVLSFNFLLVFAHYGFIFSLIAILFILFFN